MYTRFLLLILLCCGMLTGTAQTLFTYGKYSADAKDFMRAYSKNNTQHTTDKAQAIREYLGLYINSRLKIREAYERGYDTLPQIRGELSNLRSQIVETYMNDPATSARLLKEAFQRSQKDIHVAHIFISLKSASGKIDSVAAKTKRDEILQRLQKGEDFFTLAEKYSDDPSAKTNKGDMGFITVFTLPYEFENVIYSTAVGKNSNPWRSKIGYHIFRNLGERKALGKIKAQQILLAIPPGADDEKKKMLAQLADSLYKLIKNGAVFPELAATYSNDYISAANNGIMPDISVGQYDPVFEEQVVSLAKDGDETKPFLTSHGWHIVRRILMKPVITDPNDRINQQEIQQKIVADSRSRASRAFITGVVEKKAGIKKSNFTDAALWAFTDSLLEKKPQPPNKITESSLLYSIGKKVFTVIDWIAYAQAFRYKQDGSGTKPYADLMADFTEQNLYDYYRDNLEDFNPEFKTQMSEFMDGNLFFEIMQQEIWNKAQADSAALVALFEKNKSKYTWKQSADAVIFFCSEQNIATSVHDQIQSNPASWRKITDSVSEKLVADSSRYEWSQIPGLGKSTPVAGMVTDPLVNKNDNTASLAYIIRIYPDNMPRNYEQAKGLVINDYQELLEENWVANLKKKYPVKINDAVLKSISK
ncbi:MAG TPA: peptidylprolyl isomerase [Chitinophagaceae bacterium]|nr:peptidylprolyl isomerase [Chitinophagaceae bacterium]